MARFYGTDNETFYVNDRGETYLVQSPDFPPTRLYEPVAGLPRGAVELSFESCVDLEIPDEIA